MDLIEDLDGASLPAELQRDTQLYADARAALLGSGQFDLSDPGGLDEALQDMLIVIAPHLWPWLPSNDHSDANRLERLIRIACFDPGRFTPRRGIGSGGAEPAEEVWRWQARAAMIVMNDPVRAAAAL